MKLPLRTSFVAVLAFAAVVLVCAPAAFGQGIVTGSISGTVQDSQGALVAGAKITATQLSTNRQYAATTKEAGSFALNVLPPGQYDVKVEAPTFRASQSHGVTVVVGSDTSMGVVKLEVGSPSETVTVEGTAPLIEATTDQITNTFETQQTVAIPIGNNFDTLALFLPGVAPVGDAGFENTNGEAFSANGQRGRANNFQIDGQANNDNSIGGPSIFFGNQDAIQEVQVLTNYDAEYGHNMGSVVNYITKQGTNAFHGTAYEFWQGDHFDSLENQEKSALFSGSNGNFCAPGQVSSQAVPCSKPVVPQFVDNRFGGTLGGPIWKDRIWFFGSANFERTRAGGSPSTSPGLVPTPNGIQQLLAAFPNSPVGPLEQAIGPATITSQGNPTFSNRTITNAPCGTANVICVTNQIDLTGTPQTNPGFGSAFDCQASPTSPGCTPIEFGNITRFVASPFNDYEATGRVDVKVTNKDNFFGRYVFQQQIQDGVNFGNGVDVGDWQKTPGRDQQIGLDWVHSFSNTFLNQARFSFSRVRFFFEEGSQTSCNDKNPLGCAADVIMVGSAAQDNTSFGVSAGFPQGRINNTYQLQDNLTLSRGRHLLKFGGEYDKQRSPNVFLPGNNSEYVFGSFNDIAANNPLETIIVVGNANLPFHERDVAFYLQDDWKAKDNLTINMGLRWEWNEQAINLLHDRTVAVQASSNPLWDNTFPASETTVPRVPQTLHDFGPAFGFAWTPRMLRGLFGEQKTVLRGGFRIAYDPEFYNMFLNVATSAPSVNSNTIIPGAPLPPSGNYQGNQILPFIQSTGLIDTTGINPGIRNHTTVAPNFHNPYSEQWNFGVQRSFTNRIVGEVRYVGNHSVGQFQSVNGNPALQPLIDSGFGSQIPAGLTPCPFDPTGTVPGGNGFGYANCNFRRVVERGNFAWSKYNGLQTELRMGGWHGLTATASYTYSRNFDNASEVFSSFSGGNTLSFAQNPFNTDRGERAISGLDFPNLVGVTMVYDIPYQKEQHGFMGHLLGGWQPSISYRYATGQPYTTIQFRNSGSLCDPTHTLSSTYDACRPILGNASLPLNTAGRYCDGTTGTCMDASSNPLPTGTLVSFTDPCFGAAPATPGCGAGVSPISGAHWIYNDPTAAQVQGTPFDGAGRNTLRGQPLSTGNLGFHKDTKITERLTMEFQAQCFNCMNVQFRGTPVSVLDFATPPTPGVPSPFQSTAYNFNGGGNNFVGGGTFSSNGVYDGIARRRLLFGLKLKF
jgi:outer membrane receptor protein involved in Fe transport